MKKTFKTHNKKCEVCLVDFIAQKSTTRFCSPKCNNLVLYQNRDVEAYNLRKRSKSVAKQRKERYHNDLDFRLANILRARLTNAIKYNFKSGSAVANLGCSIKELKLYLESKFEPWMSWENHGRYGWHIDHIEPLTSFDLSNSEDLKKACHFTNLQPLQWRKNIIKGGY
jgi:hypothetical protein